MSTKPDASSLPPGPPEQCQRLFRLAALLREGQPSADELAWQLDPAVAPDGPDWPDVARALQRDLDALEGLEPQFQRLGGQPPRYRIATQRGSLSAPELLALLTGHRHQRAALSKLSDWLPDHLQGVVGRRLSGDPAGGRRPEEANLDRAAQAWLAGNPLRFQYRASGRSPWRAGVLETYLIEAHPQTHDLYLIGRETLTYREIRAFKLARLRDLRVLTGERYHIPESFDPHAFFDAVWGVVAAPDQPAATVALRFAPGAAALILEGAHPHLSEPYLNPDGSIDTTLEAPVNSSGLPRAALSWILGFGPRVQVLGPPEIRAHWQAQLREAAEVAVREPRVWRKESA